MTQENYPNIPGSQSTSDTSIAAAESMEDSAGSIREAIVRVLEQNTTYPMSSEQIGKWLWPTLGKAEVLKRMCPRIAELRAGGAIKDSGKRSKNYSGRDAIQWVLGTDVTYLRAKAKMEPVGDPHHWGEYMRRLYAFAHEPSDANAGFLRMAQELWQKNFISGIKEQKYQIPEEVAHAV